jgi:phosphopantetheinyl transferase
MQSANIYHRYLSGSSLDAWADRPADDWLSVREQAELRTWRDAGRRRAWLRGRALAKQLIADHLAPGAAGSTIEILSRDTDGRVNRPRVSWNGVERGWSLSISHTDRGVLAAICERSDVLLGVDVAVSRPLPASLSQLWFTQAERAWVAEARSSGIACFIWSAKEALYKACNRGESFDPRQVEVLPHGRGTYGGAALQDLRLRSWTVDGHVAVMASLGNR